MKDQHHEPLKGAIVYLENENTQAVATFVTDRSGGYEFKHVNSSENYMLWASYRGTASKKKLISRFDSKQEKNISFVLRLR